MQNVTVARSAVNIEALNAELQTAFGANLVGMSTGAYGVQVHLADNATPAQVNHARSIVQAHNPAVLTPRQQAELTRRQKLDQSRRDYGAAELDLSAYSSQPALVQQLAQKIVLLEQEIAELRGG